MGGEPGSRRSTTRSAGSACGIKKVLKSSRAGPARRRWPNGGCWRVWQRFMDPARLRLSRRDRHHHQHGPALRPQPGIGERLVAAVPHGHWRSDDLRGRPSAERRRRAPGPRRPYDRSRVSRLRRASSWRPPSLRATSWCSTTWRRTRSPACRQAHRCRRRSLLYLPPLLARPPSLRPAPASGSGRSCRGSAPSGIRTRARGPATGSAACRPRPCGSSTAPSPRSSPAPR